MLKQFIVIGLCRFGSNLTRTLIQNGHEVMAVDKNEQLVQEISSIATHAFQADSTDKLALHFDNTAAKRVPRVIYCL